MTAETGPRRAAGGGVALAAELLGERSRVARHDVAVVLGSGWAAAADRLGTPVWEAPVGELPGFPVPTALGHGGTVRSLRRGDLRILVLLGRAHLYEGHPVATVTHGVRTAVAAGCRTVLLTNAAGGISVGRSVGEAVLIADQLDLTTRTGGGPPYAPGSRASAGDPSVTAPAQPTAQAQPTTGGGSPYGPGSRASARHVDPSVTAPTERAWVAGVGGSPYAPGLRVLARQVDPGLADGVYAGLPGPHFETPAEIRALRLLGADLVGMSTVHEATAAAAAGAEVLGVSLVSNLAAGVSPTPLSAQEVLDAGRAALPRLAGLLAGVLDRLAGPGGGRDLS